MIIVKKSYKYNSACARNLVYHFVFVRILSHRYTYEELRGYLWTNLDNSYPDRPIGIVEKIIRPKMPINKIYAGPAMEAIL